MNNQVKLIDADKLLKWIESNDKAEAFWIDGLDSTTAFDNLSDAIDSGELSPDTPPVPTIKPGDKGYKCSACRESSTSAEWNMETGAYLGIAMHFINLYGKDSDTFVCPKCGEEQPRHMVEVVE